MTTAPTSLTVFIPLTVRRTGGRARIVPPDGMVPSHDDGVDPRVLKAIARAWSWRRRFEASEPSTILDIAQVEGVTDRFVSRMIRLAWLSPAFHERLLVQRQPPAVSIKEMIEASELPWSEQEAEAFSLAQ